MADTSSASKTISAIGIQDLFVNTNADVTLSALSTARSTVETSAVGGNTDSTSHITTNSALIDTTSIGGGGDVAIEGIATTSSLAESSSVDGSSTTKSLVDTSAGIDGLASLPPVAPSHSQVRP